MDHFEYDQGGSMIRGLLLMAGIFWGAITMAEEEPRSLQHGITAGISVPQPLTLGYERTFADLPSIHFFGEGGYFALPLSGNLKKVSVWGVSVGARYFPLENWLYATGALGFRQMGLSSDLSKLQIDGVSLANNADLTLNAIIADLGVGGQWFLSSRLALSVEVGMQLPIPGLHWGSTEIVQNVPDGTDLSVDDEDALDRITGMPLPKIALVRFIWYID